MIDPYNDLEDLIKTALDATTTAEREADASDDFDVEVWSALADAKDNIEEALKLLREIKKATA